METIAYAQGFLRDSFDLSPYVTLLRNRIDSAKSLERINTSLNGVYGTSDGFCIPVAGSYGRLEASNLSDIDMFIVHGDSIDKQGAYELREVALSETRKLGINTPNPRGIFVEPSHLGTLVENIGSMQDSAPQLSQRMLLLMESKPLYNENFFRDAVKRLFIRYCEHVIYDSSKEFVLLLNETIKYFRTVCVNYQFSFWKDNEQWPVRNLKLRHSRIIMYAGLLMLLLNSSKYQKEKCDYLLGNVFLTPLEKICHVYLDNDESPATFLGLYDSFLSMMSNEKVRTGLHGLGYHERYTSDHYKELKANSDKLCSELTRFVLSRQNKWTDAVFEYLIF